MWRSLRTSAALALTALGLFTVAAVALAATKVAYSGKTSQHEPISLSISAHQVSNLAFRIDVRCPHHHVVRYDLSHFSKFTIAGSSFDQMFKSPQATARVKGKLKNSRITGSISFDVPSAHCSGSATYLMTRKRRHPA